jgi:hypothetical protein
MGVVSSAHIRVWATPRGAEWFSKRNARFGRFAAREVSRSLFSHRTPTFEHRSLLTRRVPDEFSMTSPFDNVPNEVLERIFSFIPPYDVVEYAKDRAHTHTLVSQIIVLMQISRQFRVVIQQSKFWQSFAFDFESLIPLARYGYPEPDPLALGRVANLCHVLLSDSYFVSCLRRKTDWSFYSLDTFFWMLGSNPPFRQNVHRIGLRLDELGPALLRLPAFENLKAIFIYCEDEETSLDLDALARLHDLPIKQLHIAFPGSLKGSLENVANLEELSLRARDLNGDTDDQILLPIASFNTLTRMALEDCFIPPLKPFINLQHLQAKGYSSGDSVRDMLWDHPGQLLSLCTSILVDWYEFREPEGVEMIANGWGFNWRMLTCPCLDQLKKLELQVEIDPGPPSVDVPIYLKSCMLVVKKLTEYLLLLEDLKLWAGLDLGEAHCLNRFRFLKSLCWNSPLGCIVGKSSDEEDLNARIRQIFRNVARIPDVSIQEGKWSMHLDMTPPSPVDIQWKAYIDSLGAHTIF